MWAVGINWPSQDDRSHLSDDINIQIPYKPWSLVSFSSADDVAFSDWDKSNIYNFVYVLKLPLEITDFQNPICF